MKLFQAVEESKTKLFKAVEKSKCDLHKPNNASSFNYADSSSSLVFVYIYLSEFLSETEKKFGLMPFTLR